MTTPVDDVARARTPSPSMRLRPTADDDRRVAPGGRTDDDPTVAAGPAAPPQVQLRGWWRDPRLLAVVSAAVAVAAVHQKLQGQWDIPYFFDEMWRADMIRSSDHVERMLSHNTPAAIGWILGMWAVTAPLPSNPAVYRVAALAFVPAAAAISSLLLLRVASRQPTDAIGRRPAPAIPALAAGLAPALVVLVPAMWRYYYLNNYPFEVAYVAGLAWLAVSLDRHRWAFAALCVGIAGLPLFTVGGLLVAPGFLACGAWWVWRLPPGARRRRRLSDLGLGAGATAAFGAVVYLRLWRPITTGQGIDDYWVSQEATVGGGRSMGDLVAKLAQQVQAELLGERLMAAPSWGRTLATLVLVVSFAVGAVGLGRRWPWLVAIPASAYALAFIGAFAAHWPITLERVNLSFYWLLYLCVAFGLLRLITWPFRRHPSAALPAVAIVAVLLLPAPFDPSPTAFARWMTDDLSVVAQSQAPHNLVLAYHPMSHFYAHDRLVTTPSGGPARFSVVRERFGDRSLYQPVDGFVSRAGLRTGDVVWCVIPYDLGPDASLEACRLTDTAAERTVDHRGAGTWIQGFTLR
jgi:MFS family permease